MGGPTFLYVRLFMPSCWAIVSTAKAGRTKSENDTKKPKLSLGMISSDLGVHSFLLIGHRIHDVLSAGFRRDFEIHHFSVFHPSFDDGLIGSVEFEGGVPFFWPSRKKNDVLTIRLHEHVL